MAKQFATLSEHLLYEAEGFSCHPEPIRRTRRSSPAHELFAKLMSGLVEWRKTFSPHPAEDLGAAFLSPVFLDEFYSRESLKAVPGMVERTRQLSFMTLREPPDLDVAAYLREAAECYVAGLPQATVALCRAAIERRLKIAARIFGKGVNELGWSSSSTSAAPD